MENLQKINETLYRLVLPYKDIFTTIYFLRGPEGDIMFDAASFPEDLDGHILPAIRELGITKESLKYIFISHNHRDHAGCLLPVLGEFPEATVITGSPNLKEKLEGYSVKIPQNGEIIGSCYKVVTIPGHSPDSAGLLDTRTGTFLTGDSLQCFGVFGSGTWACNITLPTAHLKALKELPFDEISALYAAHDYHPYGYTVQGKEAIQKYVEACVEPLMMIRDLIKKNPTLSDEEITALFNEPKNLPTLATKVVTAMRSAIYNGIRDEHIDRVAESLLSTGLTEIDRSMFEYHCHKCGIDPNNFTQADLDRLQEKLNE